jgi:oxygen-independent coproporphyrinogen III oxidase
MVSIRPPFSPGAARTSALDLDLVRKYAVPGPRYTSYPTALQFTDEVPAPRLLADLKKDRTNTAPLSLYLHLPFCESSCWFCGCTKVITRDRSSADRYLDYLEKEISLTAELLNPNRQVVQMHFGGGTPTFLTPKQIRRLGAIVHRYFRFVADAECGVEIDPRRLAREHIEALHDIGCNRASLGVQDNNPVVQEAVNRIQPFEQTEQAVRWLRTEGFVSINVDLIYGLPFQTPASFSDTLDEVCGLEPDRFAVFNYAHVPWIKPAQKILDRSGALPDAEAKLALLETITSALTDRGYLYIGMDHFARPNDELAEAQRNGTLQRNFQGYSTKSGCDILGFGMSAISQTANAYRQNEKELPEYYAALDTGKLPVSKGYILNPDDQIRRETIMRLMCDLRLSFAPLSQRLGIDLRSYFASELDSMDAFVEDRLVEITADELRVTQKGRYLIRNIAMKFDAYLTAQTSRFSKTV